MLVAHSLLLLTVAAPWAAAPPPAWPFVADDETLHDFGPALATGLCVLPHRDDAASSFVVSFPQWGAALTPDQPEAALALVKYVEANATSTMRQFALSDESQGQGVCTSADEGGGCDEDTAAGTADADGTGTPPPLRLRSVQALHCPVFSEDTMWVLDAGHGPADGELADGAAQLLRVSLARDGDSGNVTQRITFPKRVVPGGSYLNDVRSDGQGFAFITDSNSATVVVVDVRTGVSHAWADARMRPSPLDAAGFVVGGKDLSFMLVAVDGIAYSPHDDLLYFKPVTRRALFRVPAALLRAGHRAGGDFAAAAAAVEDMGALGFHDGIDADGVGGVVLTDLMEGAIQHRHADGTVVQLSRSGAMSWPDAVVASGPDERGVLLVHVLTTQVHRMPFLNGGADRRLSGNRMVRLRVPPPATGPAGGAGGPASMKGRLEAALAGTSGFPFAMPAIPEGLTVPQQLAAAARILDTAGYALDVAGHITVAADGEHGDLMWSTPYGVRWGQITPRDMILVDGDGDVAEGQWDVTPAVFIHTELHRTRPDARVVVHSHPYYGSLLSTLHQLPEISEQQGCMFDGDIALVDEYTGGVDTAADGQTLANRIGQATAIILANHGVLVTGESVAQATYRAVTFERMCRLHADALATGLRPVPVPPATRALLKRSLNTLSVDNYWRGEIRSLLARDPGFFDARDPKGADTS